MQNFYKKVSHFRLNSHCELNQLLFCNSDVEINNIDNNNTSRPHATTVRKMLAPFELEKCWRWPFDST